MESGGNLWMNQVDTCMAGWDMTVLLREKPGSGELQEDVSKVHWRHPRGQAAETYHEMPSA